jgi:hypothetical protein
MTALTIMLIRHGEKPDTPELGPGLTAQGNKDDRSLVIRGWQRAGAWAALFGSGLEPNYPRPEVVYAADPNKDPEGDETISKRPWETIVPLCDRLGLNPVTKYGVSDEAALVTEVKQLAGVVLVSWEHKKIVEAILPGLAAEQTVPDLPIKWNGDRFDVVLRFDQPERGASWRFRQLFPKLLGGDSDVPLKV